MDTKVGTLEARKGQRDCAYRPSSRRSAHLLVAILGELRPYRNFSNPRGRLSDLDTQTPRYRETGNMPLTPDDHAILEAWRKMETSMPNVIAVDDNPLTTTGLPGETISIQAYAGHVVIEIDDHETVCDIHLTIPSLDQHIAQCQAMRAEAMRMAVNGRIKWLAGAAEQRSYADRRKDASEAFGRLSDQRQRQAARLLDVLGTDRAPSGTIEFLNITTWLSAEYGLHEASHLFEADLRAIARMVRG
jgi:hypothetical protein